mgnify:CR=1 FL=1
MRDKEERGRDEGRDCENVWITIFRINWRMDGWNEKSKFILFLFHGRSGEGIEEMGEKS